MFPNKQLLHVHLPNQQRTIIPIQDGQTVRDALARAMKKRQLTAAMCSVSSCDTNLPIAWDSDVADLNNCSKIEVRIMTHQIRRSFFKWTNCEYCQKILFTCLRCQTCGIKFHSRCSSHISPMCQPTNQYLLHLLQRNGRNIDRMRMDIKRSNSVSSDTRERSSSEPNITINLIKDVKLIDSNEKDQTTGTTVTVREPRARSADASSLKKIRRNSASNRESIKDWEIPESEIQIKECIGSGSFGTVFRGLWHGPVAVKKLKVAEPTQAQLFEFKNELAVLRKTRHVNIILFMGYVSKPQLMIVTQWCEGSSLYKHLHVIETNFKMNQILDIARQTAQGMDYLHAKKIIHRDLKSNNIFLSKDFTVKIGDFGLATVKSHWGGLQPTNQPTGSILWMAPEIIRGAAHSFQSDVYAYGIVLFEVATGMLPYNHLNNRDQILYLVGRGFLKPNLQQIREDVPKKFISLIQRCILFDCKQRPLFHTISGSLENIQVPRIHRAISLPNLKLKTNGDFDFDTIDIDDFRSIESPLLANFNNNFPFRIMAEI
ncbi:serine/threonine-protein kinase B-raf-like [Dermatophagoides pteronyssinus]|uniref:non-specific serine/threonine protein kinase n=1 Tax=Dermatophagoides pteronyssinus TaxID=6956 RepID=A0A6P6Y367_DERPT|nr:serine/threonine-protein kinase B-raf-like [Dermatophagoides pteronyssinus]